MITRTRLRMEPAAWQQELADAITEPEELFRELGLDPALLPAARAAAQRFPLRVPRYFLSLMTADPDDPLLRQVLPLGAELAVTPGFGSDPVGDRAASRGNGLLQKYRGRALVIATAACAVHCRYCFRSHYPYAADSAAGGTSELLAALRNMPDISEVILSGGDPLSLSDARLSVLLDGLADIPHVRRLRLHTRLPVVLPSRVTDDLCDLLERHPRATSMVLHANHPREVTPRLATALAGLRGAGVALLNQSVLLRGVNDDVQTLAELSAALFDAGVMPYYIHLLDRVAGAAHFDVPERRAHELQQGLAAALPGYLVPRFVRENAGAAGKTPLDWT